MYDIGIAITTQGVTIFSKDLVQWHPVQQHVLILCFIDIMSETRF